MYVPAHFEEARVEVMHELIRRHPFGAWVTRAGDRLDANHLPFQVQAEPPPFGTLHGHVARANPVWREISSGTETLVIFQGPHAYISPSWYPSKKESAKAVPTWNYAVVHVYGMLRVVEDKAWLKNLVERLTEQHEAGRINAWKLSDAPADFIEHMLDAIVGIELRITRLVGKWKMSQNRSAADRNGVIAGLSADGNDTAVAMAAWLQQYQNLGSGN